MRHGFDALHIGQHADFHRIDADVAQHRIALGGNHGRGHHMHALHALRVLRGHRSDHAGTVSAQRAKGFQIGLYACAAAGIRAGNGQHARKRFALLHGWIPFILYSISLCKQKVSDGLQSEITQGASRSLSQLSFSRRY